MKCDILIIGGGVVGTAIARELSRYNLEIVLLEKEDDVAMGSSKANSGIVHAGYNSPADTLKARLNVKANPQFDKLCADLDVPFKRIGSLVIAFNEDELKQLKWEKENGEKLGIKGLKILSRDELLEKEPNLNPKAKYGLYAPSAGIVSSYELTIALADNAVINGGKVMLETEVRDIIEEKGRIQGVKTNTGDFYASYVINAAGLFADEIANYSNDTKIEYSLRKGEYHLYDKNWGNFVTHILFPTPSKVSKGILITPTVHGNLMIGPNAEETKDKKDLSTSKVALNEVFESAKKLVPDLKRLDIINSFSGIRAKEKSNDFIIAASKGLEGLINVAGIQSPGLSAAPAIAEMLLDILHEYNHELKRDIDLSFKKNFKETLTPKKRLYRTDYYNWQEIIAENPDFAEIVCRCEKVSKGEIIHAINRPVPATSIDAVKRRTRTGTGRCQGGFCQPRVLEILAKELNISPLKVSKKGKGSCLLFARTKEMLLSKMAGEKL
ncbi:FAD-dependent oxidoreductase [Natronospora cellulosivora (SeqCode)]